MAEVLWAIRVLYGWDYQQRYISKYQAKGLVDGALSITET